MNQEKHPKERGYKRKKELEKLAEEQDTAKLLEKSLTPEEKQKTKEYLKKPELLVETIKEVQKNGVAGEEDTILSLILLSSTRLVKGASAESKNLFLSDKTGLGKDYVTGKTLETILPEDQHLHVTKMSKEAFTYWHNPKFEPEWTWDDKVIHIEDITKTLLNSSTFKVMSSGGSNAVVVKDQKTIEIPIMGKPVMIITSHHANPEDEALRRYPIGGLNETTRQTQKIKSKIASRYVQVTNNKGNLVFRKAIKNLDEYHVLIPFAEIIQHFFPNDDLMRTHFRRFLDYICASAVFHQHQRIRNVMGNPDWIVATPDDYAVARMVLIYTTSNPKMIPLSREYREIIDILKKNIDPMTIKEISLHKNCNKNERWLYRHLPKICSQGILKKGIRHTDDSVKDSTTYEFADLNAQAIPTWQQIRNEIHKLVLEVKGVKFVNTVNTNNVPTEVKHLSKRNCHLLSILSKLPEESLELLDLKTETNDKLTKLTTVSNWTNGKKLTVLSKLTTFLRERDKKRYKKYYDESLNNDTQNFGEHKSKNQKLDLSDKHQKAKQIIDKHPENNFELVESACGSSFIEKCLERGILEEPSLGTTLKWVGGN